MAVALKTAAIKSFLCERYAILKHYCKVSEKNNNILLESERSSMKFPG